jgi:hypothetical protein
MKCPKCEFEMELRNNQFYYHDGTYFSGYVCVPCNALYVNEEDSIFNHGRNIKRKNEVET